MSNFSDLIELETNASINALDENISEFEKAILFKNQHVKNVRAKKNYGGNFTNEQDSKSMKNNDK